MQVFGAMPFGGGVGGTQSTMSSKWSQAEIRFRVRTELLDPSARWWTDDELNSYIESWQNRVQDEFELVWGTATATVSGGTGSTWDTITITWDQATYSWDAASGGGGTSTATYTLSNVGGMLRLDAVYWNSKRLIPTDRIQLARLDREWQTSTQTEPTQVFPYDSKTVVLWPTPSSLGVVVFEYPAQLTFGSDDSTPMSLPAWTRYSAVPYACMRAYSRLGPNQDVNKAGKYRVAWENQKHLIKLFKDRYLPERSLTLRPGGKFEGQLVRPVNPPVVVTV